MRYSNYINVITKMKDVAMSAYSSQEACRLAGISYRQLDHWVRRGIIRPTQSGRGSGSARRWSAPEVAHLRVVGELRKAGIPLERIRRAVSWLRKALPKIAAPLASLTLVTDGKRIFYLSPNPGKLVDALAGGQLVLSVPLGDSMREVEGELPTETRAEPVQYDLPEVVEPGESGYYVGYCPVLRGCVAQGRTREEAQANLKKAIASYLSVLEEMGQEEATERDHRVRAAGR